jgi:hypothetical protein
MIVDLEYRRRSRVAVDGSAVAFAANAAREPVAFDAKLLAPLRFREAISALHDVVVSDLRYQPRDKSAYRQWKAQHDQRLTQVRAQAEDRARAAAAAEEQLAEAFEAQHRQAAKSYWSARDRFSAQLKKRDYKLWLVLDPVITVAEDRVFFECFSKDESLYAALMMDRDAIFGASLQSQLGTTNVDYSWELYHHFQTLRSYRETRFTLDPGGVTVDVDAEGAGHYREEKIDLPLSWLRGFMQLQAAMALPMRKVTLSRSAVYNLLAFLKRRRARTSPRAIRFELLDGRPPALVLEPWEKRIESSETRYRGLMGEPIRIWGRRRLLVLARLLPLIEALDVYLLGSGLPSFWVAKLGGDMQFTLALSGWTVNDWTRSAALELFAPPVDVSHAQVDRVASVLKSDRCAELSSIALRSQLETAVAQAALHRLAHAGQLIFDLGAQRYRYREIMPRALGEAELGREPEALTMARSMIAKRRVQVLSVAAAPHRGVVAEGQADSTPVSIEISADGVLRRASCPCPQFRHANLKKGPCCHILALRQRVLQPSAALADDGNAPDRAVLETWVSTLRGGEGAERRA